MPERKSDKDLLAELLAKGYGEDEKRKRREAAASKRRRPARRERRAPPPARGRESGSADGSPPAQRAESARRMEDVLPPLPPQVRRQIDRYAWRGGFLATGIGERLRSAATVFFPRLEDWAARALVRQLVGQPGGDASDPGSCSLLDGLQMLSAGARRLLGGDRGGSGERPGIHRLDESRVGERILAGLRAREPFLPPLLSRLAAGDDAAMQALEFTRIAYRRGERVRVRSLVRPAGHVCRLALVTDGLDSDLVARLVDTARDVARSYEVDASGRRRVDHAAEAVEVMLGRVRDFRHELFPVLLKCMATFFPEESLWAGENAELVRGFVGLKPEDILDYYGYRERRRRRPVAAGLPAMEGVGEEGEEVEEGLEDEEGEKGEEGLEGESSPAALEEAESGGLETVQEAEETAGEPPETAGEPAETGTGPGAAGTAEAPGVSGEGEPVGPGEEAVAPRAGGESRAVALQMLRELFPESGIHRLEQYHFILPYFDVRVFSKDLSFAPGAQLLARSDPMSQIVVLHRIIDNLISSIDSIALDQVLSPTGSYHEGLADLQRQWKEVYTGLFDPYLKELEDYARAVEVEHAGAAARRAEDTLNRMRNHAIRHFGRMIAGRGRLDISSPPLYSLAERLVAECRQIRGLINSRLAAERDRQALDLLDGITSRNVVDLQVNEYKPTIRRLRRLLQKQGASEWSPQRVHLRFFELLFAVADLYEWLLNDPASFYRMPPDGPMHAGRDERRRWASAREAAERGSVEIKSPPVSATAARWADDSALRFEGLRRAGRLAFALMEVTGREVLEAEGKPGVLALAASTIPAQGPDAPVELVIIGRDRLLAVTPRGTLAAAGWADRWRALVSALLKKHPLFGEIIEQRVTEGLGELRAGVADVSDCAGPRDALARAEAALEAARGDAGPIAVWQAGAAIAFADYIARFARPSR